MTTWLGEPHTRGTNYTPSDGHFLQAPLINHLEQLSVHFSMLFCLRHVFWDTNNVLVNIQSWYTAVLIEATAHLVIDTSTTTSHKPLRAPV